jgi:hypothetical protein
MFEGRWSSLGGSDDGGDAGSRDSNATASGDISVSPAAVDADAMGSAIGDLSSIVSQKKKELAAAAAAAAGSSGLAQGWSAQLDNDSGKYFFWNKETNETTWDRPTLAIQGDALKSFLGEVSNIAIESDAPDASGDVTSKSGDLPRSKLSADPIPVSTAIEIVDAITVPSPGAQVSVCQGPSKTAATQDRVIRKKRFFFEDMDVPCVVNGLKSFGMARWTHVFSKHGINGRVCQFLDDDILENQLCIASEDDRRRIMTWITLLSANGVPTKRLFLKQSC